MAVHIVENSIWRKLALVLAIGLICVLFYPLFILVNKGEVLAALLVLLPLSAMGFLAYWGYYSFGTLKFDANDITISRFGNSISMPREEISDVEYIPYNGFIKFTYNTQVHRFTIAKDRYVETFTLIDALVPSFREKYAMELPYTLDFGKRQLITIVVLSLFLIGLGLFAFSPGIRYNQWLYILFILLGLGGFALPVWFYFKATRAIIFEEDKVTVRTMRGDKEYPASEVNGIEIYRHIVYTQHGSHEQLMLKFNLGTRKMAIAEHATKLPLISIEKFLKESYYK
jgi:hypothetical protein